LWHIRKGDNFVEIFTSIAAVTALLISKIVHDQQADDKTVDKLEERLANGHDHQPNTDNPS